MERKINTPGMRGGADHFSSRAGDYGKRLEQQGGGSGVKGISHQERHNVTLVVLLDHCGERKGMVDGAKKRAKMRES